MFATSPKYAIFQINLAQFRQGSVIIKYYKVGIKDSWFVNHESISWSHEPKICQTSIFYESFFPK